MSNDETITLINSFDNSNLGVRNLYIVLLMLDSGMRRNEVVNLEKNDINFQDKYLVANGKGQKQRIVPLGEYTLGKLLMYKNKFKKGVPQERALKKSLSQKVYYSCMKCRNNRLFVV